MEKAELEADLRKSGTKGGRTSLRSSGSVPAVVYGKGIENMVVAVDQKKFEKMVTGKAGKNVIIALKISDEGKHKTVPVLTHEIQRNPLNGQIIHIDFLRINMEEAIKTKVRIVLIGDPVGVKQHGGILVHGLREVEIKCLPAEIPGKLEVEVSEMKIGDALHVSDLKVPKGIEIISDLKETVVHIAHPAKEEEIAPAPTVSAAEVPSEKGAPVPGEAIPAAEGKKGEKAAVAAPAAGQSLKGQAPGAAPAKGAPTPAPAAKPEEKKK